ncbi:MFS transporter [Thiocapsa sp.]|uniref:MFS transporter n=1 Tax=Thiocapsa sp. TaxID=2024551 RepID=UPI003593713E
MTDTLDPDPKDRSAWLASYLGMSQFVLVLSWTVYAVFLPDLLASVGIDKRWSSWVLLADQVLFACFDIAAGFAADRAFRVFARFAPVVLATTAVSALAFLLLPWISGWGGGPVVLLGFTALWVVTSSALRAPLFGLLARHATKPQAPRLTAIAMLGMGIAMALSPYLGTLLKELDARLPFALSSLSLLLVAGALVVAERRLVPAVVPGAAPSVHRVAVSSLLLAVFLAASAVQIAAFINAAPRYLRDVDPLWLPWLLPVFWIGFSLALYWRKGFGARADTLRVFVIGCFAGAVGFASTTIAGLGPAILGFGIAGLGWGLTLGSAFALAAERGAPNRVATFMGILFAVLAGAAFLRIGFSLTGWPQQTEWAPYLVVAPPLAAVLAAVTILTAMRLRRLRGSNDNDWIP